MRIRKAQTSDGPAILEIILPIIREGATYTLDTDMGEAEALAYWLAPEKEKFVAANQAGGGRHVCNCGYMTRPTNVGRGVARAMYQHSLTHARERGYQAMQYNFVVSTNERAVRLWQSLGFEVVGRLPGAFLHPVHGYVDALVMYQRIPAAPSGV